MYLRLIVLANSPHQELAILSQAEQLLSQHHELYDVALVAIILASPASWSTSGYTQLLLYEESSCSFG